VNLERIVLGGASHPDGTALRMALEESSLAVREVALLDPAPAGLLTQFRGEPNLSTPLPREPEGCREVLEETDLAFLCGDAKEVAPTQAWCARSGPPAVSLAPRGPDAPEGPCVFLPLNAGTLEAGARIAYAPSAPACAAARILAPLQARAAVRRVATVVLVPVSEECQDGPQALHDQAVALLSMKPMPEDVFPQQRAFNLVPRGPLPRFEEEAREILGLPDGSIWASAVASPVFRGYGLGMWVEFEEPLEPTAAGDLLRGTDLSFAERSQAGPVEAMEAEELRLAPPAGEPGRIWLWAAFEGSASGNLDNALDLARTLIEGGET